MIKTRKKATRKEIKKERRREVGKLKQHRKETHPSAALQRRDDCEWKRAKKKKTRTRQRQRRDREKQAMGPGPGPGDGGAGPDRPKRLESAVREPEPAQTIRAVK